MGTSKTDRLVSVLGERIGNGTYPPGGALPSERELTGEFGVSRVTVRNAIERLETQRLVARAPGRGTYVRGFDGPTPAQAVGSVALVSSQLTPSVASPIAAGCSSAALAHRVQLLLCDTGGSSFAEAHAKELLHLRALQEQGVGGVILWWQGGEASVPVLERMVAEGVAVVFVDRFREGLNADCVGIDDAAGACAAVRHLIGLGHRRIGCVVHSLAVSTSLGRLEGYRQAMRAADLPCGDDCVMVVDEGRAGVGGRAADRFLGLPEPPTALLIVNDFVAVEIIEALAERGVRVPEDMATVSFADMEFARHFRVPLTTVHQPFRSIGETAVYLVCERIETGRTAPKRVTLPTSIIVRRSCGR